MKKIIYLSFLAAFLPIWGSAQDIPMMLNALTDFSLINPAAVGMDGHFLGLSHRRQLSPAFQNKGTALSPEYYYAFGQFTWADENHQTLHERGAAQKNGYFSAGFNLIQNNVGVLNTTQLTMSGSWRFYVAEKKQLSFGLAPSMIYSGLNNEKLEIEDPTDATILSYPETFAFDVDAGADFRFEQHFHVGLSANNLIRLLSAGDQHYQLATFNAYIQSYFGNEKNEYSWRIKPMVLFRTMSDRTSFADISIVIECGPAVQLGLMYRTNDLGGASVGFGKEKFRVLYNFRHPLKNQISAQLGSTHELSMLLHFKVNRNKKIKRN